MQNTKLLTKRFLVCGSLLAGALPSASAHACGPFFDPSLLESRAQVVSGVRWGDAAAEFARLLPPSTGRTCTCKLTNCTTMPKRADVADGRSYEAGAKALLAGDVAAAQKHFEAVLALPAAQRAHYSVAAAFMLGRLAAPNGQKHFEQARALAAQGLDDPLCLGTDSLGELGRQALQRREDVAAFHFYVDEHREGGYMAEASLRVVAEAVQSDDQRLRAAMRDPLLQHWLVAATYAAPGETWDTDIWSKEKAAHTLAILAELPTVQGADRLAAAAWAAGEFALAERFAPKSTTALALWVQAKVATRHGHTAKLREQLDAVIRAATTEADLRVRDGARQDLLALAMGEKRWDDAALLALQLGDRTLLAHLLDQVMDTATAVAFVDGPALALPLPQARRPAWREGEPMPKPGPAWSTLYNDPPGSRDEWRYVVGRRLLRSGQGVDAEHYFPPELQARVRAYTAALQESKAADGTAKARALYRAANLLHPDGMDLIGTELGPDWAAVGGSSTEAFDLVRRVPFDEHQDEKLFVGPRLSGCAMYRDESQRTEALAGPCLLTVDEQLRTLEARPLGVATEQRYHYRYVKSQLLEQAADAMPKHTQAFAALLCAAEKPIHNRDPARSAYLYQRYAREGALVPGLWQGECPLPEFERADRTPAPSLWWRLMRPVRRQIRQWRADLEHLGDPPHAPEPQDTTQDQG